MRIPILGGLRLLWIGLSLSLGATLADGQDNTARLRVNNPGSLRLREQEEVETIPPARTLPVTTPERSDESGDSGPPAEAISFQGIEVGTATTDDLVSAWGPPLKVVQNKTTVQHIYALQPFERVDVTLFHDRVMSISVEFKKSLAFDAIAKELQLTDFEPVEVLSADGKIVGLSYPERGVSFGLVGGKGEAVSHLVFDAPDAQPFVLRARQRAVDHYAGCLHDAAAALQLDPKSAEAHGLRAQVLLKLGRAREALEVARAALRLAPHDPAYRLLESDALMQLGEYAQAVEATQQAIADSSEKPQWKARAVFQLGEQVAAGPKRDYRLALDYHLQALEQAQALAGSSEPDVAREASDVLFEAHLAAARDIAWGNWKSKNTVVSKWLEKAGAIAEKRQGGRRQRLDDTIKLCRQALDAYVGLEGQLDPADWIDFLDRATRERLASADDPFFQQHLKWELGSAQYDAMQIYQHRGDAKAALKFGQLAVKQLDQVIDARKDSLVDTYLVGRLYFRLGSIEAIAGKNHKSAVAWFDKALPVLSRPMPTSAWADPGRQGETLVSMSVSYWATGEHEKALQLTQQGLEWMQQAVKEGILDQQALAVPYTNLGSMHSFLGDKQRAKNFAELADRIKQNQIR